MRANACRHCGALSGNGHGALCGSADLAPLLGQAARRESLETCLLALLLAAAVPPPHETPKSLTSPSRASAAINGRARGGQGHDDFAAPFLGAEQSLTRPGLRGGRVGFNASSAGHMMSVDDADLAKLTKEIRGFIEWRE